MIIDTHTHFYDPTREQGIPWPNEDDPVLYRTVLPRNFLEIAEPVGVTKTVVVEASGWLADNDWILGLAADESCIVGFVGNLNPAEEASRTHLDRLSENPLFRGIRIRGIGLQEATAGVGFQNLEHLASRSLALDVLVRPGELEQLADLVRSLPDLAVVIDHVAHVPVDGGTPDSTWQEGMRILGGFPHVYCKISGLVEAAVQSPAPSDPSFYRPVLDVLWQSFGEKQLLYASNWPVCEKAASYATVFDILQTYFRNLGDRVFDFVFCKNAIEAYRLSTGRVEGSGS